MAIQEQINRITNEVGTQGELIAGIKTALSDLNDNLAAMSQEVSELVDMPEEINVQTMTEGVATANEEIVTQTDLISQLKDALSGKSISGDGVTKEIENMIDSSGVLDDTSGTVAEKVEELIDKAEFENAWYIASKNINLTNNNSPFIGTKYGYKTLPRIDCSGQTSLVYSFSSNTSLEYVDWYIDAPKCKTTSNIFSYCSKLKWIRGINLSSCESVSEMFYQTPIERIELPLDVSSVTSVANMNMFKGNTGTIKEIYFVENCIKWSFSIGSPYLTTESIQSIFDGLAYVETAQTLTLHSNLKILQSQVDSANEKGWTVAGGTVVSEEEYYG